MFIDFEGIDGSGKTTLSNAVANRLRKAGYRVAHAREGGTLQAPAARRIRDLTRDAQLLELSARSEFFLNLARDAQQLEEVIKPALGRGEVCISDRYLYSQLALSGGGRGLPSSMLEPAVELASQGIWPDLVVLVDVDPDLARMRKRLGKLGLRKDGDSRKGLVGAGLAVRVREAFLELARKDPSRWLVVENNDQPLWTLEQRIADAVLARLEGREPEVRSILPAPRRTPRSVTTETLEPRFFGALDEVEGREQRLCAYLLTGLPGPAAQLRRLSYLERCPELVARSLTGLRDARSWELREVLRPLVPLDVLSSVSGDTSPEAMALRTALFEAHPDEAVAGLRGDDSAQAWELRERAWERGLWEPVLNGLAGLDAPRAWELRASAVAAGLFAPAAKSLTGVAGVRADALRRELYPQDRLAVLRSTTGLDGPFAQQIREALFDRATKVVLRSLTGLEAPYTWALRVKGAPLTKEALDSVDGMDTEEAWQLRERWATRWAPTVLSSLRPLPLADRARELMDRVLAEHGERLAVLRNAYSVLATAKYPDARRVGALRGALLRGQAEVR